MTRHARVVLAWRLLRDCMDQRVVLAMGCTLVLVAASGALSALSPLALKHLLDIAADSAGRGSTALQTVLLPALGYLAVLCAGRIVADLRPALIGVVDQRMHARLTRRFFDQTMSLPMAYLLKRKSGELVHSLDLAASGTQLLVGHILNSILPVLIELTTMAVILLHLDQPVLLAVFGVAATTYITIFSIAAVVTAAPARAVSAASLQVHGQLTEDLSQVETLRCFVATSQSSARLHRATASLESAWTRLHRLHGALALAATAVFTLCTAASLALSADAVLQGTLSAGGFVLTTLYMLQIVRPLEVLGSAARDLSRALGFLQPLLGILAEPGDACEVIKTGASTPRAPAHHRAPTLTFCGVHFRYEPLRPVISDLDLCVHAGKTTAIVGRSGSGKSSLVRLLMRLYATQAGRILVDGEPIESMPVNELRGMIGLVTQETALMHATIAENIAIGNPGASLEDIKIAARGAQLHGLIDSLPNGYDTIVGERGLLLSGGERQRIAIARALLMRPRLFVLDEPTSMLDSATEAEIHQTMRMVTTGCTTLIVAHRLATVMHADEIVVLDEGRALERGRHEHLLSREGQYARLWKQQMATSTQRNE